MDNTMIDPSLIIASRTIEKTFRLVREFYTSKEFKFYLPKSFQLLVYEDRLYEESPTFKFFQQNAYPAHLSDIKSLLRQHSNVIATFESTPEHKEKYRTFLESLMEECSSWKGYLDKDTLSIIFEEWVFLQEYSLMVSRIKRTFNRFIDAGGICLQFGRKTFEKLVRRTLKKRDDELIGRIDKLRAFAKWIAVGGPTVLSFFGSVASAFGSLISGYFLLFDPIAGGSRSRNTIRLRSPKPLARLRALHMLRASDEIRDA